MRTGSADRWATLVPIVLVVVTILLLSGAFGVLPTVDELWDSARRFLARFL